MSGILSIGNKITNITSYTGNKYEKVDGMWRKAYGTITADLTSLPNGSEVQYLYDHQNLGCYECIISGLYQPVVKYYNGELRKLFKTNNDEMLIFLGDKYVYLDGVKYDGTPLGNFLITDEDFARRKKSIYTAIAKYRKSLYKANDYVNR